MDLKYISSNDNIIEGIALENSSVIVKIELWDGKKIEVEFINYAALKEKTCVGIEIGDIIVDHSSTLMSEVFADMLRNGGKDDLNNIKSHRFMDAWEGQYIMLEILAEDAVIKDKSDDVKVDQLCT